MDERQLLRAIRALADVDRFRILRRMAEVRTLPVCSLAKRLGLPCATVHRHLAVLLDAGIVFMRLGSSPVVVVNRRALAAVGETLRERYGLMKTDERSAARAGAQSPRRRDALSHRARAREDR